MLPAREPLFLSSGDNLAVNHQASGRIVIKGRKTEDIHGLEEGVDERSDDRALGHNQQAGNDDDENENWSNPSLPATTQECPELFDEGTHIGVPLLTLNFLECLSRRSCSKTDA